MQQKLHFHFPLFLIFYFQGMEAAPAARPWTSARASWRRWDQTLTETCVFYKNALQVHSVTFISPNNTRVLAHQGSRVHIPCRINKPPNSAMVR